jgi:hypothetical protein
VLNCVGGTPADTHGCRKRHWGSNGRRFKSCQPDESKQALTRDDAIVTQLNESKLGPFGDHKCRESSSPALVRDCRSGCRLTLGRRQGAVAGDFSEAV